MKLKIDVDIDWIEEGGNIDDVIKQELVNSVYNKVKTTDIEEKLKAKIDKEISDNISKELEKNVSKTYNDFIEKEIVITDRYGDVIQNCKINDLIKKRFDEYLKESVDEQGRSSGYGKTMSRINWIIDYQIKQHSESFVKDTINKLEKNLKDYFSDAMKKQISDVILNNTGLKKLIEESKIK